METTPPPFGPAGQRSLAAIVFTDVVGFSARMHRDEEQTYALLQRDFADMRQMCEAHKGSVLKTTGDGLLCYFASAVKAVACALEMQRHFASLARMLPPEKTLQHRIGIHLGDVLVQDQDVMGDGVNIASRLQAEAEPGGICISQTVYDVVKNKLELQATYLGERDLKNITQAVPAYRLILEAQQRGAGAAQTASAAAAAPTSDKSKSASSVRRAWPAVAAAVAVIVVAVAVVVLDHRHPPPPVVPPAAKPAPPAAASAAPPAARAPGQPKPNAAAQEARRAWFKEIHDRFLVRYDYLGLAEFLDRPGNVPPGINAEGLRQNAQHLMALKAWALERLSDYTPARPLRVPRFGVNGEQDYRFYGAGPERFGLVENNGPRTYPLASLQPPVMGLLVESLLKQEPHAPADVLRGALTYARFYNLTEMDAELRPLEPKPGAKQVVRGQQKRPVDETAPAQKQNSGGDNAPRPF